MKPEITQLANGLRVATLAMPGLETAAVALNADVGARHETGTENGLAHLFEHMLFKGTGRRSARQIAEEIEDAGGSLNAWTSRDNTCFHARILSADMPLAVDLIADLLNEPRFDAEDVEKEREVVLSEIGEAFDTPDDIVFDLLQSSAYPGQSLGRPVLGTAESLGELGRDTLFHWRDSHYRGQNLVLAAAGNVDHDSIARQAEALFGGLAAESAHKIEPARWQGGGLSDTRKGEQLHMAIGFEAPNATAPDYFAAQLFVCALGGGMSSRLFQELREERGLAYSVSAAHVPHADTGMMSIYCAARPKDAAEARDLALKVAADTADTLTLAELARARAQLKAGILMGMEGCAGQADWLGRTLLTFGRFLDPAEVVRSLEMATLEDVRRAGARMLSSTRAMAAVGPLAGTLVS